MTQVVLNGKRIAITGRLASLTREAAVELIVELGGEYLTSVSKRATHLVVGAEGWPLEQDGRLTRKLEAARSLQAAHTAIAIVPEEQFLRLVGLADHQDGIQRLFTTGQLARILGVTGSNIRAWVHAGLIEPARIEHRLCYFAFAQVASAKALCELVRAGATLAQIRHSIEQLRPFLDTDQPLKQLAVLEGRKRLVAELDGGRVVEPGGQLHFDFAREKPRAPLVLAPRARSVDEWFEEALEHEDAGRHEDAERAYRQALLQGGPEPELCFNLGNVLFTLGRKPQAIERYRQAIELDHEYVEAWNNLGNALSDSGDRPGAIDAYRAALELAPSYADVHYNLAATLREMGRMAEARAEWRAYLEADPHSTAARQVRHYLQEP